MPPDDSDLQKYRWKPAAETVGIYTAGFGLHQMRRMSVTLRQECGATPVEAMRQAGHTRMSTTLEYTLHDQAREHRVVDAMERLAGSGPEAIKRWPAVSQYVIFQYVTGSPQLVLIP
jgi:integrase